MIGAAPIPPGRVAYATPLHFDEDTGYIGGGERYPRNLARAVRAASGRQVEVDIITFGRRAGTRGLEDGVELTTVVPAMRGGVNEQALSWQLPAAIARSDLVHVHQGLTRFGESVVLAAKLQHKPVCLTDHGGSTSDVGVAAGMLDAVDSVVAYSDFGARMIPTTRRVHVVKGGVDDEFFRPPTAPAPRHHVMYVGRLLPHKGVDRLIAALPDGVPLLVCGRPYDAEYYRVLCSLAEGRDVTFVTDADDAKLRDLYGTAIAVVLPSVYRDLHGNRYRAPELMGFTLLEGMACGAPALCSDVAAMPEFVEDGVTGFVCSSSEQMTSRLAQLATNPDLVRRMGDSARASVERCFGLMAAGSAMLSHYRDVCAAGAA